MSVAELRARLAVGAPPGDLRGLPPRIARAVAVAGEVGAPALPALAAAQRAEERARDRARALRVASAQGRAVAVGLVALPLVLVPGLARLLDLDLVGFYTTPAGVAVAGVAGGLLAVGGVAVRALLRRVGGPRRPGGRLAVPAVVGGAVWFVAGPWLAAAVAAVVALVRRRRGLLPVEGVDEVAELVATAVTAGIGAPAALRAVVPHAPAHADVLARLALALELDRPLALAAPYDRLQAALRTGVEWGAPVEPALRELADDLGSQAHHRALEAVERLPALLTVPTTLCLLPASVLLVGAPLVGAALAST